MIVACSVFLPNLLFPSKVTLIGYSPLGNIREIVATPAELVKAELVFPLISNINVSLAISVPFISFNVAE